jgi:crossover junction endodeoxyribonuclease RusA
VGRRKSNKRPFTVTIPGRPRPKGRPRLGRGGRVFTPKQTLEAEANIRDEYLKQNGPFYEGPVQIDIIYRATETEITITPLADHTSKLVADVDNLVKTTLDGLQGAAFDNDKIVMIVRAEKR